MDDTGERNLATALRFLEVLGSRTSSAELEAFFHPDVVQIELPNRLVASGARRGLKELLEASDRGLKVLTGERYEVKNALAVGERVAIECVWTGRLAVPVGSLAAGAEMRGHISMFIDFRDGRIIGQRNYDCFEPF